MPGWLLYTLGIVIFALGLVLSIALHEIGHMVPAKRFGVKVTQYMVGFGPTIWSRKRGDTEYGLKAVPMGGYIRMIGMVPPRADGKVSRWPRRMSTAIEDFRHMSRAEIDPADEARQFYRLTPGKKMIVMLGGPTMNLVIYLVLSVVLLTGLGIAHNDPTTTVGVVYQCVVPANSPDAGTDKCPASAPTAPAFGKLQPGDRILAVNGTAITNWNQLTSLIEPAAGQTLSVVVEHNGVQSTVAITPVANTKLVGNSTTKTKVAGYVGISPTDHYYYKPVAITAVPGQIGTQIRTGWDRLMQYPARINDLFGTVFEGKQRNLNSAIGVVGIGRLSGDFARSNLLNTKDKITTLIGLLAGVNLLLFFFNLLPLLPLDGGHVAGAMLEAAKRGRVRLRARFQPARVGPNGEALEPDRARSQIFVDTAQMLPVMYAVGSLLIVLTLLTLYADIVSPVNPFKG
jgi:membrane-associated protease RseP (regulator of RpoE activity)